MAKSADDAACVLTVPTSITDLTDIIRDYFEDRCARDPEEDDSTCGEDFAGTYIVNEV